MYKYISDNSRLFLYFILSFISLLAQRNEAKERAPGEKPIYVFASRFQEFQNSRAYGTLRHAEILFLKTLAHTGLFYGIEKNYFFHEFL